MKRRLSSKQILLILRIYWQIFVLLQIAVFIIGYFTGLYKFFLIFSFIFMPFIYPALAWTVFERLNNNLRVIYSNLKLKFIKFYFIILLSVASMSIFWYFVGYLIEAEGQKRYPWILFAFSLPLIIIERRLNYFCKKFNVN